MGRLEAIQDRVAAWHPEEVLRYLLVSGEHVYEWAKPDWRITLMAEWPVAVGGVLGGLVLAAMGHPLLAVTAFFGGTLWMLWRAVTAWYTSYVLTNFRVMRVSGVLSRNVEFIPWRKVTDVSLSRSALQRAIGASTIRIESANEASQFRAMTDVRDPVSFFRALQEVMAAFSGRVDASGLGIVPLHPHGSAARRPEVL